MASTRGVSEKVRAHYGLGYAPDSWDYLLTRLGRKYSPEKLEKAGLALPRKSGSGFYDRFRNRLMIPIHSEAGTVIGFGGRSLDGSGTDTFAARFEQAARDPDARSVRLTTAAGDQLVVRAVIEPDGAGWLDAGALPLGKTNIDQFATAQSLAATYGELASSRRVLEPVLAKLGLAETLDAFRERITVITQERQPFIDIVATGATPEEAKSIVDGIAAELVAISKAVVEEPTDVSAFNKEDLDLIRAPLLLSIEATLDQALREAAAAMHAWSFTPAGTVGWHKAEVMRGGAQIKEATGVPGTDDNTADYQNFSDFIAQKGVAMFGEDGSYGVTQEIVEEYWSIWAAIREAGATPPGPESAGLAGVSDLSQLGVVTGKSATSYLWSNQLVGAQGLIEDPLGAAMYPNTPDMIPGSIIQPSQFVCLSRDSIDPEAATAYMSAFVNDLDITAILGLERGIPSNPDVRAALEPNLSPAEAVSVAFFDAIQGKTAALAPPPPAGSNEVEQTFERVAVSVLLGDKSIPEVAADFLAQANAILARA